MGRQSRRHRERRNHLEAMAHAEDTYADRMKRIGKLEEKLRNLVDGDAIFWISSQCSAEIWESHLEDVLAFESIGSGISLFEGLQQNGVELPHPDQLDEYQSANKVMEILLALEQLRMFLIGFEAMTARELYRKLWNETLWEGCYVRKRNPRAITLVDVSHKMLKSDMLRFLEDLQKACSVH